MIRKPIIWCLGPDPNSYYQVVGKNVITTSSPTPMMNDLVEWSATEMLFKRSPTFAGVFREMTIPATFSEDGAHILRHVFYSQGTEGACYLTTKRLNTTTQLYETISVQAIDFTQFVDTDSKVTVKLKDAGLGDVLKAKENTVYEIPIVKADSIAVLMDGVVLRGNAHYIIAEQGVSNPQIVSNTLLIAPAGAEGLNEAIQTQTSAQLFPATLSLTKSGIYKSKYSETFTVTIKNLRLYVLWPSSASTAYKPSLIVSYGSTSSPTPVIVWQAPSNLSPGQSDIYNLPDITISGTLGIEEQIGVVIAMLDGAANAFSSTNSRFQVLSKDGAAATIDISSEYRRPATVALGYRGKDLLQKVADKLPGGPYTVQSDYLTRQNFNHHGMVPRNVIYTSGDAIRGLGTTAKPDKLKITISEFQKDGLARSMAGIGAEGNTLRYEHLSHFFQEVDILPEPLTGVTDFQVSVATDYLWNTAKFGYPQEQGDKLNGKNDPLLSAQYATAGLRSNTEKDLVSPYCASYVTHETLRANLAGKKTTDSSSDDSVHLLEISNELVSLTLPAPFGKVSLNAFKLARRQNDPGGNVSGVIAGATAYNLGLTYARCVRRNGPLVRANMNGVLESTALTFQTAEQNSELVSKLGSDPLIIERADIPAAGLDEPMILALELSFNAPIPDNLQEYVTANPYGLIPFWYEGSIYRGFILEIGIKQAVNDSRGWKLLASKETNLTALIR